MEYSPRRMVPNGSSHSGEMGVSGIFRHQAASQLGSLSIRSRFSLEFVGGTANCGRQEEEMLFLRELCHGLGLS